MATTLPGLDPMQPYAPSDMDEAAVAHAASGNVAPNAGEQPRPDAPAITADPPEEIQQALLRMVDCYERESDATRRRYVMAFLEAEEFWKGNQLIWWSERSNSWLSIQDWSQLGYTNDPNFPEPPDFNYITEIYQPLGLVVMSALTARPASMTILPQSAEKEEDIATAKAARRIQKLFESNNNQHYIDLWKAYYLWTQGAYASYIRYVVDGGKYGYTEVPVTEMQPQQVVPDRFQCPNCYTETPAGSSQNCLGCGAQLDPNWFIPGQSVDVPVVVDIKKIPNGAETQSIYGPLFWKAPPQARAQEDCYYFILSEEVHISSLRAAFPAKADKIGIYDATADDNIERIARLRLAEVDSRQNSLISSRLVTYKRAWLRPSAFWEHCDETVRGQLLQQYPNGVRVEFCGTTFLQAVPENLDDYWTICPSLPGMSIYGEPLGRSVIPIQRQVNDATNLLAEYRNMASAPPILYNAKYIDGTALSSKRMQPASYTPVAITGGAAQTPINQLMWQPNFHLDPQMFGETPRLIAQAEMSSGAMPSLYGGGEPNLDTATAYGQSKNMALARLEIVWKRMQEARAKELSNAIGCFQRNRSADAEMTVEDKGGVYRSEYVHLNEVRGAVLVRTAADDGMPSSWEQVRDTVLQLMQTKDPEILELLGHPVNRPIMNQLLGLPDLVDPTEGNREKQARETAALAKTEPTLDPQTGEATPTILPDVFVDDHDVHIAVIQEWATSDIGIMAKQENPAGYANVMAHLMAHKQAKVAAAQKDALDRAAVQAAVASVAGPAAPGPGTQKPPQQAA